MRKTIVHTILIACIWSMSGHFCCGQQMSVADSLYVQNLKSELSLSGQQSLQLDSIILSNSSDFLLIEKEIQRNARTEMNPSERDAIQSELLQKKKRLKAEREFAVKSILNEAQLTIYDTKIKPGKPAVLHMGINHDRASCTTCLPK